MRFSALFFAFCLCLTAANPKLFAVHDGEHCGFADSSGNVKIPSRFQDCGVFSEGLAAVQTEGLWGYIDESGAAVIPPRFVAADPFSESLAFVTLSADSKAVIDRQGKVLFAADYYEHGRFSDGLAAVHPVHRWMCPGPNLEVRDRCPDGKGWPTDHLWGYIDKTGAMAIEPREFASSEFHEGLAPAFQGGFIDRHGNQAIGGKFSNTTGFSGGIAAVQVDFKTWGYIDKHGGWLALPTYDEAGPIVESRGLVRLGGRYGYVDASGSLAIPAQFEHALPFSEGLAAVCRDGKWGYIDASGNAVIPFRFLAAQSFEDGFATVVLVSGNAVIDRQGATVRTQPASLTQTFQRLQGFEVAAGQIGPLAEVIPILAIYKEQLRQLAEDCLRNADDAGSARAAIEAQLQKAGIRTAKEAETRPYGLIQELEIVRPPLQPQLLSVSFHLRLADATDTSLSIFRHEGSGWHLAYKSDRSDYFKWEMDAYHTQAPQFTASDAKGSFLMLLASASGPSGNGSYLLRVDVFRVDGSFEMQSIFHQEYGGKDHQIALDANAFRLEIISMEHDAARAGYRTYPYRYEFHGDKAVRTAPIGFDVHDFLGEWGNLAWEEAARWSNPSNPGKIRQYYDKVRGPEGYFGGEFSDVQVCDAQQRLWQIELDAGDAAPLYFLIERTAKWTFFVKDISDEERDGCTVVQPKPGAPQPTMFAKPLEW
jgi:hypothetical protein